MQQLTTLEKLVIDTYVNDEYIDTIGDQTWVNSLSINVVDTGKMTAQQFSGVMSSLVQKGIMYTDGTVCNTTPQYSHEG